MSALAMALIAMLIACQAGDNPDGLRLFAAVAASLEQSQCAETQIELIDYLSGDSRLGPVGKFENLAVSPSGKQLAVVELTNAVCDSGGFHQRLMVLDIATLVENEISPDVPLGVTMDWSPSGEYLAVFGLGRAAIYDVRAADTVTREWEPKIFGGPPQRWQIAWPTSGAYLLMFLHGATVVGVPRVPGVDLREWTLECEDGSSGSPVSMQTSPDRSGVEVFAVCGRGAGGYSMFEVSGVSGNVSDAVLRTIIAPQGFSFETFETITGEFPGSALRFGSRLGADRRLSFAYLMYSPSGNVEQVWADDGVVRSDTQSFIAVRLPSGELVYVPIALDAGPLLRPDLNFIHDVVVLD